MERGADPGLSFASLLRQLRVQTGLTQEQLAEAAGISTRGSATWNVASLVPARSGPGGQGDING
jgi:hypothetical protein